MEIFESTSDIQGFPLSPTLPPLSSSHWLPLINLFQPPRFPKIFLSIRTFRLMQRHKLQTPTLQIHPCHRYSPPEHTTTNTPQDTDIIKDMSNEILKVTGKMSAPSALTSTPSSLTDARETLRTRLQSVAEKSGVDFTSMVLCVVQFRRERVASLTDFIDLS